MCCEVCKHKSRALSHEPSSDCVIARAKGCVRAQASYGNITVLSHLNESQDPIQLTLLRGGGGGEVKGALLVILLALLVPREISPRSQKSDFDSRVLLDVGQREGEIFFCRFGLSYISSL